MVFSYFQGDTSQLLNKALTGLFIPLNAAFCFSFVLFLKTWCHLQTSCTVWSVVLWYLKESMYELLDMFKVKPLQKLPALFYSEYINYHTPTHFTVFVIPAWKKHSTNLHSAKCEQYIWPTNKMQTQPMKCAVPSNVPYWFYGYLNCCPLFICPMAGRMWRDGPLDLLCAWEKKDNHQRIREREDRPSHPDAANLLPASHVNRYAIVWSTACFAWTETQPRR